MSVSIFFLASRRQTATNYLVALKGAVVAALAHLGERDDGCKYGHSLCCDVRIIPSRFSYFRDD
jgi:hypothetical protein